MSEDTLEPSGAAMLEMIAAAMDRIVRYTDTLPDQPAYDPSPPGELAALLREPLPESGAPLESLLSLVFERLVPKGVNTASPGSLSYVTGGGIFHAALAGLISSSTNRYVGYWGGAPGMVELELRVIDWLRAMVGMPSDAGGILLTGGSMANLTGLVTARREKLGERFLDGVLYASDQMHHSVKKSAHIAGFPSRSVRAIESDALFRISMPALQATIAQDRANGLQPFCIVANAGSTNTGAIDDLEALADLCERQNIWLHVDAAYGGFFMLTERGRAALSGLGRADSVVLDPHKSMFLPFGSGCLLVRDPGALTRAHEIHSDYVAGVAAQAHESGARNFADMSAEMSREARGLKLWLPFKLLGAGTFRRYLDEKLDLARYAAEELERIPGVRLVARPQLSILAFQYELPGLGGAATDALNERIMDRVNRSGVVHLSPTVLRGRFTIRICVLPFRAHRPLIVQCVSIIRDAISIETEQRGA